MKNASSHDRNHHIPSQLDRKQSLGKKATRLQTGGRWVVVRTNSCHTSGFRKLQICRTRRINLIDAFVTTRRLIRKDWKRYR